MRGKYVIFMSVHELEFPVLIPDSFITHKEISGIGKPISAGFFSSYLDVNDNRIVNCHGKSVSLGLESRPEHDSELIKKMFSRH